MTNFELYKKLKYIDGSTARYTYKYCADLGITNRELFLEIVICADNISKHNTIYHNKQVKLIEAAYSV